MKGIEKRQAIVPLRRGSFLLPLSYANQLKLLPVSRCPLANNSLYGHSLRSPVRDFCPVEIRSHQPNAKATRNKNGRKTALANASNRPSRAIFSMDGFRLRRSALLRPSALFDAIKICDAMVFPPFSSGFTKFNQQAQCHSN